MAQQLLELGEEDIAAEVVPLKSERKREQKKNEEKDEEKENNKELFGNGWTFTEQPKEKTFTEQPKEKKAKKDENKDYDQLQQKYSKQTKTKNSQKAKILTLQRKLD